MKQTVTLSLLVCATFFLNSGFQPSPSVDEPATECLETARRALRLDGIPRQISRVEIVAEYTYLDEAAATLKDRTVMGPQRRLYQERYLEGERIERQLEDGVAFLSGPQGRVELDGEMLVLLEDYLCIRQLQFLMLCPGLDVGPRVEHPSPGLDVVQVLRGETLFAELEMDADTHRLVRLRYSSDLLNPTDEGGGERAEGGVETTEYADFRPVDGWMLPHRVSGQRNDEPSSFYIVEAYELVAQPLD